MSLLEVSELRAGFGPTTVLHGMSFDVAEGEAVVLLGLNGAGKSVTIKVVAGLIPPWGGAIRFAGDDVTALNPEARVARGMAHVPQGRQVFPDLTVEQNLRLGAYTLRRRDKSQYPTVLSTVLARFPRLAERRDQLAGTMSGGEQAMLAMGRALMAAPRLLIVDEPTAGLSPIAVEQLKEAVTEVRKTGVTVLLVEQNVRFALDVADRVEVVQRGRVVYSGPSATVDRDELARLLGIGRLLGTATKRRAAVKQPMKKRAKR